MTAKVGHDHALHLRTATVSEFALVAVALIVAAASGGAAATHGTLHLAAGAATFDAGIVYAVAALLAAAMGIQNAVARKLAVPDLTTTVLTMTLTGIGHDARSGHRGHVTLIRRVLVVATMLAGGVIGAELVLNVGTIVALALATGLLAIVAAAPPSRPTTRAIGARPTDKDGPGLDRSVNPLRAWGPSQRAARSADTSVAFSVRSATVTAARALRQASSAPYMTLAMPQGCRH